MRALGHLGLLEKAAALSEGFNPKALPTDWGSCRWWWAPRKGKKDAPKSPNRSPMASGLVTLLQPWFLDNNYTRRKWGLLLKKIVHSTLNMQKTRSLLVWMRWLLHSEVLGRLRPQENIISENGVVCAKSRGLWTQAIWTPQFCLGLAWSRASKCISSSPWPTLPTWIMDWKRMFGSKPWTDWVTCGW